MGRGDRRGGPRRGAGRERPWTADRARGSRAGVTDAGYQPQYRQIEQALRERIATLPPGDRLPSDADLCAEFGVSRMTARNAMQRLADDGLIRASPGAAASSRRRPPTAGRTG